jgi:release factor glutamine methyltransferase
LWARGGIQNGWHPRILRTMAGNLTIDELLTLGFNRLRGAHQAHGAESALGSRLMDAGHAANFTLDTQLLLAHVLGKTRTYLATHPEAVPTAEQIANFEGLLERRAAGEPIAYIVGYRDFWTLTLAVNPSVLVPRPETELLVERTLALGPQGPAAVADLGTGSGAIALALASERPQWSVTAVDISPAALATARANAASLELNVEFLEGAWFAPLKNRRFHVIASNPPYVSEGDAALKDATLQHEPQIALASGADGLTAIREIVHSAPDYLERHGWLILEHGSDQAAAVAHELEGRGFGHVRSHRDLAGHWRLTEAQWPLLQEDTFK